MVHILAPSGSGKTTLIHLIYGLRKDFDGQVLIDGQATSVKKPDSWSELRQKHISIVFQDLRLFPSYTGRENIQLKSSLTNMVSENEIEEMAQQLGVLNLLGKPCEKMSQGERQRIAVIRALTQPFDWILLDEPFSHLDETNISKAAELIWKACKKRNAGLLLATLGFDYGLHFDSVYCL